MNDTLFNVAMSMFALIMLAVWMSKPIHTGFLGSLGCVVMAASAAMSIDDSLLNSVENIQMTMVCFAIGALLCVAHLVLLILRAKIRHGVPINVPHRRETDVDAFDEEPQAHCSDNNERRMTA